MAINLFFNKSFSNKDYKYIKPTDDNFVINGYSLVKIDNLGLKYKGIFNDFSDKEITKVITKKKNLEKNLRKKTSKKIFKKLDSIISIHHSTAHSLERLLMFHNRANIDVNAFFFKYRKKICKSKINFHYGGNYRLEENLSFIYWLFLMDKVGSNKISFYAKDHKSNYRVFKDRNNFFNKILCTNNSTIVPSTKLKKIKNQNILYVDGLRHKDYWCKKYDPICISSNVKFKDNFFQIKINSNLYNYEIKLFEDFLKKSNINLKNLNSYTQCLKTIEFFCLNFTLKIIEQRFRDVSKALNKSLNIKKIKNFYLPSAPFIESIIILNYMKIKKKRIYLLPHSITPSHEIHPDAYLKQYCFNRSSKFMPSTFWYKNSLKKEKILKKDLFNSFKDKNSKYILFSNLNIIKNLIINLNLIIIISRLKYLLISKLNFIYQKLFFKYILNKEKKEKVIGIILNIEIFETSTEIDFNKQNQLIVKIFKFCSNNSNYLLIRRKPGWSNRLLMKDYFKKNLKFKSLKRLFICNSNFIIKDYLKNLDVCIFFQGGSAMIESIQNGVPVILVSDRKCQIFSEPYIEFPKNIVPKIDTKDLAKFLLDKNYLNQLLKKQTEFIKINL